MIRFGAALAFGFLIALSAQADKLKGFSVEYLDCDTALEDHLPYAEQGDVHAQLSLGHLYHLGLCFPPDYEQALMWFGLAAEQGDSQAQELLGHMYENAKGVPQDDVTAYMWYALAAAQDHPPAAAKRDTLAERMDAPQIEEAELRDRAWMDTHQ